MIMMLLLPYSGTMCFLSTQGSKEKHLLFLYVVRLYESLSTDV